MKLLKKSLIFVLGLGSSWDTQSGSASEFTYEQLYKLVPFESVSVRGAVMQLKSEALVNVYQREGLTRISLTSVGREQLRAEFKGLRPSAGKREASWTVCLFLDASESKGRESKPLLRPVRSILLDSGFLALERGMYVIPGPTPVNLVSQLSNLHALHRVLIFETRKLVVGDERAIIRSMIDVKFLGKRSDLFLKSLSSLQKQVSRKQKLHPQTTESFISLIPKLMEFFADDVTVPELYFPQEIRLSDIKSLLFQVSAEILPKI